jgi:hypothetical protein
MDTSVRLAAEAAYHDEPLDTTLWSPYKVRRRRYFTGRAVHLVRLPGRVLTRARGAGRPAARRRATTSRDDGDGEPAGEGDVDEDHAAAPAGWSS